MGCRWPRHLARDHRDLVPCLLWACFIWGNSLVPGGVSTLGSDKVAELALPVFSLLGVAEVRLMTLVVRKLAHLFEYAVLGGLVGGPASPPRRASRAAFFLVPVVDEALQLLVPGRSGMLGDVVLDLAGMLLGLLVAVAWRRIVTRRSTVLTEQ